VTATQTTTCPACGASATGRFCSTCGYALEGAQCSACKGALVAGARFCHRCGSPTGAAVAGGVASGRPSQSTLVPWAVAGFAFLALIALVLTRSARSDAGTAQSVATPLGPPTGMRGPDLSTMSPRERADRLFNRVMSYQERGVTDSVQFFADMGIRAYQMLPSLDHDARYDMGRIAEAAGSASIAKAQADSILRESPTHLLGLALAARAARLTSDDASARTFDRRLIAAETAERRKSLPEYERHATDIDEALRVARRQSP
jgi:hypothetical protein